MPNAWTILLVSAAMLLAGCATPPVPPATPLPRALMGSGEAVKAQAAGRWHTTCFNMPFDGEGRPVWGRDLLLADRVAAPLLAAHAKDIVLWRFHRRAARDAAGHRFSLLLYADDASYAAITTAIDADPTVASMLQAGSLSKVVHDCRAEQSRADVAATSDPQWPAAIQRTWPYFIMGVSASWLALIEELATDMPPDATDPVTAYSAIDAQIAELWAAQGQHAYLHHLSGLYGYKPLRIQTWMQF